MDEHQTTLQSNSSDAASDDLSNSILGKMKCSVSKMLPNSISNWLSPKVDAQNSRRRRHDELDSEEEETEQNRSRAFGNVASTLVSRSNNFAQASAPAVVAAPPTKRQRIFTPSPFSTYSTTQTLLPRRESIISSTLIEEPAPALYRPQENGTEPNRRSLDRIAALDNTNPFRTETGASMAEVRSSNNDLNFPQSRSQPTILPAYRAERDLDETSSNRSTNPFTLANDSMAVNFSAHLQKSKSLFSNKSYVSQSSRSLSNYRMRRQRNSSLYRSTSSLCDNNSNASSNASSVLSSPFYNGQTTFGGASAQSKRFASAFHSQQHRAKIPSKLVPSNLSKSTSSLNVTDTTSMSGLSTTAKRILEIMNQSSTPLGDVRRVSNALPTMGTATSTSSNRRLSSLLEVSAETRESDIDKMKRKLLKPNTPYNRPVGRTMTEPCFTQGLNVPSMPQLLQLKKKLTNNTIRGRELASQSNSILNKPMDTYKLAERAVSSDLDATNNNHKSPPMTTTTITTNNNKHVSKIRNNITSKQRKAGKIEQHEMPPEPVDLPNVQLKLNSTEIKLTTASFPAPKAPIIESRKIDTPIAQSKAAAATAPTFKMTPPTGTRTNDSLFSSPFASAATLTTKSNNMSGNAVFNANTLSSASPSAASFSSSSSSSSSTTTSSSASVGIFSAAPPANSMRNNSFDFANPIFVKIAANCTETDSFKVQGKQNYKFSEPIVINSMPSSAAVKPSIPMFGDNVTSAPSAEPKKAELSSAQSVPSTDTMRSVVKCDDTLKALAAKQTQNKWSCSSCCTPNENSATKCVCCGVSQDSVATSSTTSVAAGSAKASISSSSGATATVDDVFKSFAAKQKQSKWACDSCMADNDVAQVKCLCCGGNKPGSVGLPASTISAPKVDDLFKSIAAQQKSSTWACSACDTKNDMNKSKCVCCQQTKESDAAATISVSDASTSKPKFTFGSGGIDLGTPSGTFLFGSKPVAGATAAAVTSNATSTPQFTFGSAKSNDITNSTASPITFGTLKNDSASTSSAAVTTTAAPKFSFGSPSTGTKPAVPLGTFAFGGAAPKIDSNSSSSSLSTSSAAKPFAASTFATSTTSSTPFTFANPSDAAQPSATGTAATTAAAAVDDVFKKIVSQQTVKWSCSSCMAQNNQTDSKCICCNTLKPNTADEKIDSTVKTQNTFGSPSTSTFSFGSKPSATLSTSFQFGAPTATAVTSSNAVTSTSNTFSLSSTQPSFGSPFALQSTSVVSSTVTSTATTTVSKPFSFGSSAPTFGSSKFGSTAATFSSDVTDTAKPSTSISAPETAGIKVLENVLIQSPASVAQPKPLFSFGTPTSTEDKTKSISLKRPSTDVSTERNLFKAPTLATTAPTAPTTASMSTPFLFGQPNSTTNPLDSSSNLATNQFSNSATAAPAPAFSFGTINSSQSTPPPSFGFNATPTLQFGASAPSLNTTAAPAAFGSNIFPSATPESTTSNPAQSAFPSNAFSFGASNTTPSFGNPTQNPAPTEQAQPQSGFFQFGANANQSVAPTANAFSFNANAAPSFNFSSTTQPQADANAPFQFSQAASPSNLFAPQSSSSSAAIRDRRKFRAVRRVNRP